MEFVHVWHIRGLLGSTSTHVLVLLLLLLLLLLVGLRVLLVLVLAASFFLTVEHHQLLGILLVLHAKLLTDLDKTTQTVNVVRVLLIDLLVNLKGFVEQVHAAVATGNHEGPFDFLGLNLAGTLKVNDGLLEHVLFGVMHAEARDHVNLCRVVTVGLLVEMDGLELILLLLVKVAHFGEDLRISGHLGNKDVVPLEGLATHANQLVNVRNLVDDLV